MKLDAVGMVYSLSTVTLLTALGTFYFGEKLTLTDGIGLVLAISGLTLLSRFA